MLILSWKRLRRFLNDFERQNYFMFKRFYPDMYIDSAYDIDFQGLFDKGYRGIIFDIDNTLVEHGAPVTDRCRQLFDRLRNIGFDTCIISNNKEARVKPLADAVDSNYVSKAGKPSPVNYIRLWRLWGRAGLIRSLLATSFLLMCGELTEPVLCQFWLSLSTSMRKSRLFLRDVWNGLCCFSTEDL